jgi:hypothetical protein
VPFHRSYAGGSPAEVNSTVTPIPASSVVTPSVGDVLVYRRGRVRRPGDGIGAVRDGLVVGFVREIGHRCRTSLGRLTSLCRIASP